MTWRRRLPGNRKRRPRPMHTIIYIVGLVVVIGFILSLLGLV
jgi:hypothetical protein